MKEPAVSRAMFGPLLRHAIVRPIRVGVSMNFFAELKRRHMPHRPSNTRSTTLTPRGLSSFAVFMRKGGLHGESIERNDASASSNRYRYFSAGTHTDACG